MTQNTVLVVEDDKVVQYVVTKSLSATGYFVTSAESAEEALKIMVVSPAEILILDLNLPGMNGVDLCREIRKRFPWCIIIAVTGYASVYELVSCREAGFEDYFIKPVDMSELLTSVTYAFKKIGRWKQRWTGIRQQIIEHNQPPSREGV